VGKIVNQTELAEIFGVSDVTIWDWQGKGLPIARGKRKN
jgi:phage terminase Nu1 subunit (DNA packaging protein)